MTWRQIYKANVLKEKYGAVGKVAARYVLAGFNVRVESNLVYIKGSGTNAVLGVVSNEGEFNTVMNELDRIKDKLKVKTILVLYGNKRWREDLVGKARDKGLDVKFIRE